MVHRGSIKVLFPVETSSPRLTRQVNAARQSRRSKLPWLGCRKKSPILGRDILCGFQTGNVTISNYSKIPLTLLLRHLKPRIAEWRRASFVHHAIKLGDNRGILFARFR